MRPPCEVMAEDWRRQRKDQESCIIACVLYYVLGWPITLEEKV